MEGDKIIVVFQDREKEDEKPSIADDCQSDKIGVLYNERMEVEENTLTGGDERKVDGEQPRVDQLAINLKACCVCGDEKASLRCPKCRHKYCHLECYRQHKSQSLCTICDESVPEANNISKPNTRQYFYPSKDTLPVKSLELLCTGDNLKQLKTLLENKNLRNVITHLNHTHNPIEEFRKIMLDEKFVEFADFILNILQEKSNI